MEQLDIQPQQTIEQQNLLARYGRRAVAVGATVLAFAAAATAREYVQPSVAQADAIEASANFPTANETSVFEFQYPATAEQCKESALRLMTSGGGYDFANARHDKLRWIFDVDPYDPAACKQFGSVTIRGYGIRDAWSDHHGHGTHWRRNTPKYTFMTDPVGGITLPDNKYHFVHKMKTTLSEPMRVRLSKYNYESRIISTWTPADGSASTKHVQRMDGASS